jgi:hypothetical protein
MNCTVSVGLGWFGGSALYEWLRMLFELNTGLTVQNVPQQPQSDVSCRIRFSSTYYNLPYLVVPHSAQNDSACVEQCSAMLTKPPFELNLGKDPFDTFAYLCARPPGCSQVP